MKRWQQQLGDEQRMASRLFAITFDANDPDRFWAGRLGREAMPDSERGVVVRPGEAGQPRIRFRRAPNEKLGQNRMHFDLVPDDHDAEVARLLELGAGRTGLSPPGDHWGGVVLVDPDDNEFCVRSVES